MSARQRRDWPVQGSRQAAAIHLVMAPSSATRPVSDDPDTGDASGAGPVTCARQPNSWRGLVVLAAALSAVAVMGGTRWLVVVAVIAATLAAHEFGHFVAARVAGMKVTEFFVGFGPRVWSARRGETEYGVKAVWAGAYVRIVGMNNLDRVESGDEARSFRAKSYTRKMVVLVAGPAMHFVMAGLLLFAVVMSVGVPPSLADAAGTTPGWTLGTVAAGSAAAAAGLQPGDEIVSVDGVAAARFDDFSAQVSGLRQNDVAVIYLREGEQSTVSARVGERLTAAGAAAADQLNPGDRIVSVEGLDSNEPPRWEQVAAHLRDQPGRPVNMLVAEPGADAPVFVRGVVFADVLHPDDAVSGFFGVSAALKHEPVGVSDAAVAAGRIVATVSSDMVITLPQALAAAVADMFDVFRGGDADTASTPADAGGAEPQAQQARLLSVYGLARIGADAAEHGLSQALVLLAVVNMFLGVFNLLPVPPLDGGHAAVATYERLRQITDRAYRVDAAKLLPVAYLLVVLLLLIGATALIRDILDPIQLR